MINVYPIKNLIKPFLALKKKTIKDVTVLYPYLLSFESQ